MPGMPKAPRLDTIADRLAHLYNLHPGAYRTSPERFPLRELDRLAGISEGMASQIIGGSASNPTVSTLRGLAGVLGCSVGWLSDGEGDAPSKREVSEAVAIARTAASKGPRSEEEGR